MMEVKLWTVVCVLLLTDWGSATNVDGQSASSDSSSSSAAPGAWSAGTVLPSSLALDASTATAALNRSDPSPNDDVAAGNSSVNATTTLSPSASTDPENNQAHLRTTASPNQSSTPHLHLHSTSLGPAQTPGDVSATSAVLLSASASSVGQPDQGTLPFTPPSPPVLLNTTVAPKTSQSATSSTGSPQGAASSASTSTSASTTTTSPKHTAQPDGHPETSRVTQQATTAAAPTCLSTQAKPHAKSPSQLNVGDDTTMLHQSPAFNPLLAGLVSAFIITAVVITLLLFLKMRRRNSRPEFRRLQDLPMDDMEEAPLSMYSY